MTYEKSNQILFLLDNGEMATPVKVKSKKSGNVSFRSAPHSKNVLGSDWSTHEVEVTEAKMVEDVLTRGRRTRCVSLLKPIPSLRGKNSRDVVAVYVRAE